MFDFSSMELSSQDQLLQDSSIPESVWESALVVEKERCHRMDVNWSYLRTVKHADGTLAFQKLADVAILVLTLPNSNAEEERVFSLVNKNKTKFHPTSKLEST